MQDQNTTKPTEKRCTNCRRNKPINDFYRHAKKGLQAWCKVCQGVQHKEWMAKNAERFAKRGQLPILEKQCYRCGQVKSTAEFGKSKSSGDGFTVDCRLCKSEQNNTQHKKRRDLGDKDLWRYYRIRRSDYERMMEAQGGRCGICRVDLSTTIPCVDHDHITGFLRGILCPWCNGQLSGIETVGFISRALAYLSAIPVLTVRVSDGKMKRRDKSNVHTLLP